ncbi:BNR repeat domain protein [Cystobacter fuscus DSM 2262]|uniref:BNR repeat domain protein n=1 Tax=Cystobacter fuscus (strain ATCC 25194 / DSM 2262 / NBRC 100088 / M29) TaxID=1242864 RepID=S9QA00_CYSF2|nr:BNR repeat domain protein [Cystobacter fuscus]EPX58144.1 BNR repeat domain protein [Cystobacter fuscus DSM 2262]
MKRMSSSTRRQALLLTLAGLITSSGCMDFTQAQEEYCQRHPQICPPPPGGGPAPSPETGAVSQVSSRGQHTLALRTDGSVWAWGRNDAAQLGDETVVNRSAPTRVAGLSGVQSVASGYFQSLALGGDGSVWAWGLTNSSDIQMTPAKLPELSDIIAISAGTFHSLALQQSGSVWFWGELLDQSSDTPVLVEGLSGITTIAAGNSHSLALDKSGVVWAWGDNTLGQLGNGTQDESTTPVKVQGLPTIKLIAAGGAHSLALDTENRVWTWGSNDEGQLGNGNKGGLRTLPIQVLNLKDVKQLAAGIRHSLALTNDGNVMAWGSDSAGQLGDDLSLKEQLSPVETSSLTNVIAISAGHSHSLALLSNGALFAWGSNSYGQLGGSTPTMPIPLPVMFP